MQITDNKTRRRLQKSSLSIRAVACSVTLAAGVFVLSSASMAFQIAPMGSAFESKLTNETENSLATVAGRVGVLIKGRVHEEITQIGMGCPIEPGTLAQDVSCSFRDLPFATPYGCAEQAVDLNEPRWPISTCGIRSANHAF